MTASKFQSISSKFIWKVRKFFSIANFSHEQIFLMNFKKKIILTNIFTVSSCSGKPHFSKLIIQLRRFIIYFNSNLICPIVESNLSFKFTIFKFNHQIYHSNLLSSLFKTNSSFKFTFKFIQNKFINQIYFQVYLSYLPFLFSFISLKLS